MSEGKNIYQRINKVMQKVKYVQKDANVQGYKAVTHDQVVSVCRQSLVDEGVLIVPTQLRHEMLQTKGGDVKMSLYEADYNIAFVNIDNPEERIDVAISSQAQDNGDKAPGKALSYATKYAILKLLCLETGENDESRTERYQPITAIQVKAIENLLGGDETRRMAMLEYVGAESVEEIQKADYDKLVAMLKRSKNANS